MPSLIVTGKVVTTAGEPVTGKVVSILPRTRADAYGTPVTTVITRDGTYTLSYSTTGAENSFDVYVIVSNSGGGEIGRSVFLYDVSGELTVDIVVGDDEYSGRSEYRRIEARIEDLRGDVAVVALDADYLEYLAAKLGMDPLRISLYIHAHRMNAHLASAVPADAVPAWAFYALLRMGLSTNLGQLLAEGRAAHANAIASGIARGVISDPGETAVEEALDALQAQAAASAVWADDPVAPTIKSKFRRLLDTASGAEAEPDKQLLFIQKHLAHTGTIDEFWAAVEIDKDLGPTVVATYQWTIQISALANDHMPLIERLQARREDVGEAIKKFRDLAELDVNQWIALLNTAPAIGAPPSIPTDWPEEDRVRRYAETLERIVADTYPTAVVHQRIVRDHAANPGSIAGAADLIQFFIYNPDFELLTDDLEEYLADNTGALDHVTDAAATKANLKRFQRLTRLAPRGLHYNVVKPLYQAEIYSAFQISRMSRANFLRRFGSSFGGEDIAGAVYQKAAHTSSIALATAARFSSAFNPVANSHVPSMLTEFGSHAELKTIFGNLDFCACEDCRSVFSPSAYFVDLLHFLANQPGQDAGSSALDVLKARRPELTTIELSCINTNTEVPYIDLVNELLEYHVSRRAEAPPSVPTSFWQTTWTAEELAIRPEHQIQEAYEVTAQGLYPWLLPFDLPFAETSMYHQSFDVSRERMVDANPAGGDYADRRARARLGLDQLTWSIIINSGLLGGPPGAYWNVAEDDWPDSLRVVSTFLKVAELELPELATLLRTRFIGGLEITYANPPDDCNLDLAQMTDLDEDDLGKIHRFVRLQRKLGWTAEEIDHALHTLGGAMPALDAEMVRKLAVVHRLKERLGLPLDVLLTLWSPIATHTPADDETKPSFYTARFINRVLDGGGTSLFAETDGVLTTPAGRMSITSRVATVQAALGVSGEQVVFLDGWIGGPDNTTTMAKLSAAHRRTSLAKALGVSLLELRRLIDVVGSSPFHEEVGAPSEIDLAATESFLAAVAAIRGSAFTSEQLAYLLQHTAPTTPGVAPSPEVRTPFLKELAAGVKAIADKYSLEAGGLGEGPLGERLRAALAEILAADEVEAAMAIAQGNSSEGDVDQEARIAAHFDPDNDARLVFFSDVEVAKNNLVGGAAFDERAERYNYILTELYAALRERSSREFVVQRFAEHFGVAVESMQALLSEHLTAPSDTFLLDFFVDDGFFDDATPEITGQFAYERVHKSARVIVRFELDATDLHYLYGDGVTGWLDLDALPSGEGVITPVAFAGWKRLFDYTRARALFPHHPGTLSELRAAADTGEVFALLVSRLGWSLADVSFASETIHGLSVADFDDEAALLLVAETVTVARLLYTPVRDVYNWATSEPNVGQAVAMRKALRGRYDESTWRGVARSIQDVLRVQQRDALVATLIARGIDADPTDIPIASADQLYAYLLMDVEMSVCMMTSRIRFALSGVQQFIQRVFLALEEDLQFDEDAENEWQWMKHYRVWEANRKVFLYPENWIDPALRDDKSEYFRELEETLLQGDVTKSLAETAYVAYLEKLQSVAIPEVMGMYHERDYDPDTKHLKVNDLHVVARTGHGPYRHVYRKRQDLRRWTAWEDLPGDIQSDHIMPMVYGGRLYVFWVEFRMEDVMPATLGGSGEFPIKQPVADLFWIEKRNGSWTSRFHAEGCKLSIGDASQYDTLDWVKRNRSCMAFIVPETQALEIHVCAYAGSQGEKSDGVTVTTLGRFVLKPKIGRFVSSASGGDPYYVTYAPRRRLGQRWLEVYEGRPAKFRLPKTGGRAELFSEVTPSFRTLFRHDLPGEDLSESGFFVLAERHQFYVVPKATEKGPQGPQTGSMNKPPPNATELLPWSAYAFLPTDSAPLFGEHPMDLSQKKYQADSLQVPMKWKGTIPGVTATPTKDNVVSGQSAGMIKELTDKSEEVLLTPPAPKMDTTLGYWEEKLFRVFVFQHTYAGMLLGQIRRYGVEGLLRPLAGSAGEELSRQQISEVAVPQVADYDADEHHYRPGADLTFPTATAPIADTLDFSYGGAFSLYNWEIFFHAPLLIGDIMSRQGRYEEADSWLRAIFDPTASDIEHANRFWRFKPFFTTPHVPSINDLLRLLQGDDPDDPARLEFEYQVEEWRDNPFNPHLIARLRTGAYQWVTLMRYLDNLIAWGDARFAEDTIESINEATQIYMLAKMILGDRPVEIKKTVAPAVKTYDQIDQDLDSFSNALVELEPKVKGPPGFIQLDIIASKGESWHTKHSAPRFWYFCVPGNPKLLSYWDVVEDRLFKIRHCQDIHGVERRLALFDPPIDPGQIIKALAGGGDLASALSQLTGRAPVYRFQTYLSKAYELASEVKALGSGLLQAYEKRDAEELALLRNAHERSVLALARAVKEAQIEEAAQALLAAESARPITQARRDYYQGLIQSGWIANEHAQIELQQSAMSATESAGLASFLGSELGLIPDFDGGVEGVSSPVVKASFGGSQLAAVANMIAGILHTQSSYDSMASSLAGTTATYERRLQDWKLQVTLADLELAQIEQQVEAARARKVVSEKELRAHDQQIENAEVEDAFMRSKYTDSELYGWMIGKLSSLYKQAYELAYRAAVAAEKAYQYELHTDESFIGFGYWDQSRAGLLAGELLALDLRRLDAAYLDNNIREYELTKRISLAQLDPYALVQLRETGSCYMRVPEHLFDFDHPGHYLRRIKMVSVALPGVTGPHVNVGCTLTLESSKIRVSPVIGEDYAEDTGNDGRFKYRVGKVEQIATSSGQDSTGMFESNLNDPRFLPFEGAGVIATWRIDLPQTRRQFDYRTIADVVVTVQYTAREGGGALRTAALANAQIEAANEYANNSDVLGSALLLRASTDFSAAWHAFLYAETATSVREFDMDLVAERFPYLAARWPNLEIKAVRLVLVTDDPQQVDDVTLKRDGVTIGTQHLQTAPVLGDLPTSSYSTPPDTEPGPWKVTVDASAANPIFPDKYRQEYTIDGITYSRFKDGVIRDMVVIVHYELPTT
ncbi:neuraminidase-like domain-containing protein [Nannocystis punicea]|uniref:Neuraminidase-like domain-containing protein n=1 Tax=Nannocystis punicea TaxID=2995304 RepID=A0ABY7GVM7_9BACT|nr:neuraminidase-like domain-containing protein [Nannocystis poenicansa]WAS90970.1 neuraminidase-like domain-containing protein [Nannocystis poenicansa]